MTETFFSKFPIITYNGVTTRNITERVGIISGASKRIPTQYHPWEIGSEMRADHIANDYYKDPGFDWLIYLTNGITDPYYDWYLTTDQFNEYIETKYGDIPTAESTILFYRNNWSDDDIGMTVAAFTAAPQAIQKYYTPVFGVGSSIINYIRRQEDWTASTNQIVQTIFSNATSTFTEGSYVNYTSLGNVVGSGQIVYANTTVFDVQHISGFNNPADYGAALSAVQTDGNASASVTSSKVQNYVIPLSEQIFYSPVAAFDVENEKNESQKFIYLLDSGFALSTAETIRKKLNSG
jgi:Base plate wedge protein 53